MEEEKNVIELEQSRAIIYLPSNCFFVTITCKIVDENGEVSTVESVLSNQEIQKSFRDADMNYTEDDDRFVLTEKGREYVEWLMEHSEGVNDAK